MIPSSLRSMLETLYDLGNITAARVLEGGYWNRVLRVESARGPFVLRISHPSGTTEAVAYEHALMRHMHRHVPQVPAPIAARDGTTYCQWDGRVISLFPLMPGTIADRERAPVRVDAARVLAAIHTAALEYPDPLPRPGYPPLQLLDWDRNRMWDWRTVHAFLSGGVQAAGSVPVDEPNTPDAPPRREIAARLPQIEAERSLLRDWIARLAASGRPLHFAPIHGDYYRHNLLAEGDRITAVLDWDDCQPEWLAWELGRAVWEFSNCGSTHTLQPERAREFLKAYEVAGGAVPRSDFDLLFPFIRSVRLIEVLFALDEAARGQEWDPGYTLHNLIGLENLPMTGSVGG